VNPVLEIIDLRLQLPTGHLLRKQKPILKGVTFEVPKGAATAYLGPNGAGKSSTFRILCGLIRAHGGEIRFEGREVPFRLPARHMGFMPEQPYFYRHLTPRELLAKLAGMAGMRAGDIPAAIDEWAQRLDFAHVLDQPMKRCSKGQTQRVGLAQALLHRPPFVLLDEPLSGLDPVGREQVKQALRDVVRDGATLLFSSHILADAEDICDHVVILNEGTVLYQGHMQALVETGQAWEIDYEGPPINEATSMPVGPSHHRVTVASIAERDRLLAALPGNVRV